MMNSRCSILVFFLLLVLNRMEARRSPEDNWKHVMGDEPLPESIKVLVSMDNQVTKDPVLRKVNGDGGDSSQMVKHSWDRLIKRDFDTKSVAIIYHHHNDEHPHPHGRFMPDDASIID